MGTGWSRLVAGRLSAPGKGTHLCPFYENRPGSHALKALSWERGARRHALTLCAKMMPSRYPPPSTTGRLNGGNAQELQGLIAHG